MATFIDGLQHTCYAQATLLRAEDGFDAAGGVIVGFLDAAKGAAGALRQRCGWICEDESVLNG